MSLLRLSTELSAEEAENRLYIYCFWYKTTLFINGPYCLAKAESGGHGTKNKREQHRRYIPFEWNCYFLTNICLRHVKFSLKKCIWMYDFKQSYDNHILMWMWKLCETAIIDLITNFGLMTDLSHKIVLWNWPQNL